jgi:hypothetical protein
MTSNLLVLAPADPFAAPDHVAVIARLSHAGFMGSPLAEPGFYKPGQEFFQFITFLGCSPVVALGEPGATAEICRMEIAAPLEAPVFLAGTNLKPPRCPGCGYRSPEGRAIGEAWQRDPHHHAWVCPTCGREYPAPRLGWRHSAGFGRLFLKIWGVFEGEAVPSDRLAQVLTEEDGRAWSEFYLQLQAGG